MDEWISYSAWSFLTTLGALILGVSIWVAYEWLSEGYDNWRANIEAEHDDR